MRNAIKKAISVLLVAVVVFGAAPLAGFVGLDLPELNLFSFRAKAAASGTCGENLTWTFDEATGELVISGTGDMTNWSWYGSQMPWKTYASSIKSVKIADGVTSIGSYAYYDCESLESVTIPESVTTIGNSAFFSCDSLAGITIPSSVTSIGTDAFFYCDSLASFTVDPANTEYLNDEYGVLYNKDKSDLIQYPAGSTTKNYTIPGSVTSIGKYTFYSCDNLTNVTISDGVTNIERSAFRDCENLESITIPSGVTNIGEDAFYSCDSLAGITIPGSVTSIGENAFFHCDSLASFNVDPANTEYLNDEYGVLYNKDKSDLIQYPAGSTTKDYTIPGSVTSIGKYTFYSCDNLTNITISDGVTNIEHGAFMYCENLKNITVPESVTSIGEDAFYYCNSLAKAYYPGDIEQWQNISIGEDNDCLLKCVIYECDSDNPYSIGTCGDNLDWRLYHNSGELNISGTGDMLNWNWYGNPYCPWKTYASTIKSVKISDGVTSIGNYAFYDCGSLESITLPESLTRIGYDSFGFCESLKSVTIPDGVTVIGYYAFSYCDNLTSIIIPDSVKSIGTGAFRSCDKLTSITIPDGVTVIDMGTFSGCQSLTNFTIPDSVTKIDISAFENCKSLKSIIIPDGVTSIEDGVFSGCSSLTSITIPDSVTSIRKEAFYDCDSLTSITIPDGVTSIGNQAFCDCDSLTSITIPDGVTSINNQAFYNCDSLASINIPSSVTSIGGSVFAACKKLESITVDSDNTAYSNDEYGVLFNKDKTVLIQYPTGNARKSYTIPDGVTGIGKTAFGFNDHGSDFNSALTEIVISDGVTSIGNSAFANCNNLLDITIPDSVTQIGSYAFADCEKIEQAKIGNGVTGIGSNAFYFCIGLERLTIGKGVTALKSQVFSDCIALSSITVSENIKTVNDGVFSGCKNIKDIYYAGSEADWKTVVIGTENGSLKSATVHYNSTGPVDDDVTDEPCTEHEYANDCDTSCNICGETRTVEHKWGEWEVASEATCTQSGSKSRTCISCGTVETETLSTIPHTDENDDGICEVCGTQLETIHQMYGICGTNLEWSLDDAGVLTISGSGTMYDFGNDDYVSISPETKEQVADGTEGASTVCRWNNHFDKIKKVVVSDTVESISAYAFRGCYNLEEVYVPDVVINLDPSAFDGCGKAAIVCKNGSYAHAYAVQNRIKYVLEDNVNGVAFEIKNSMLISYNGSASNVVLPAEITSIGIDAFKGNDTVEFVEIPYGVLKIFNGAFANCPNLEGVVIPFTVTEIGDSAFSGTNAKIYCYNNSYAHNYAVTNGIAYELITVILSTSSANLPVGDALEVNAVPSITLAVGVPFVWGSSDASIAAVNENGKVTAINTGKAVISVLAPDGTALATCSVTVIPDEYNVSWVVDGVTTKQIYKAGDAVVAPADPVKTGYKFVGWTPAVPSEMPAYDLIFTAVFEASGPENADFVKNPSQTTISYGDAIILHVDESKIPAGGYVEWTASNSNFSYSANGTTCEIYPQKSGNTIFTATIYDAQGNAVFTDEQTMTSKAGFFDKIIAFFKKLFGSTKVIPQVFKGI